MNDNKALRETLSHLEIQLARMERHTSQFITEDGNTEVVKNQLRAQIYQIKRQLGEV